MLEIRQSRVGAANWVRVMILTSEIFVMQISNHIKRIHLRLHIDYETVILLLILPFSQH